MTIKQQLQTWQKRGWDWFKERAHGAHAKAWLAFFSFSESFLFVIPPEILLIAILLVQSSRWMYYALLTTVASVVGALVGYTIGAAFFDIIGASIVEFYNLTDEMALVENLYKNNDFWVVFTAAFTPIPYKVFVLSAGFFKINIAVFLLASLLGRALRYYIIAYLVFRFGERVTKMVLRYTNITTFILILLAVFFLLLHFNIIPLPY